MTTRFIGIKDFRQNLSTYTKKAKKYNICYIVLRKNVPMLEIRPINEKKFLQRKLEEALQVAENDIKAGRLYSQEEIMKEFGLQ